MYLYRIEATIAGALTVVIVIADSDEKAFDYAEQQLEKHFIAKPVVEELCVLEKKRMSAGNGYVIETESGQTS
ncbi:DUF3906 family protein [Marinicrinis sediminis]|uniref:DUF3906 family protein n=1 Tax=Marinicrinis sediminis TaxID=1652465 RepID=A0ABW5R7X5_9BACL